MGNVQLHVGKLRYIADCTEILNFHVFRGEKLESIFLKDGSVMMCIILSKAIQIYGVQKLFHFVVACSLLQIEISQKRGIILQAICQWG